MASSVGHSLMGIWILVVSHPKTAPSKILPDAKKCIAYIALANLPDLDLIFSFLLYGDMHEIHKVYTHNFPFAVLGGFVVACLFCFESGFGKTWLVGTILISSHVVMDFLAGKSLGYFETDPKNPMTLLYPFSNMPFSAPFKLFYAPQTTTLDHFLSFSNFWIVSYETGIFFLFLWLTLSLRGKKLARK